MDGAGQASQVLGVATSGAVPNLSEEEKPELRTNGSEAQPPKQPGSAAPLGEGLRVRELLSQNKKL
jgi:hypothetical protein